MFMREVEFGGDAQGGLVAGDAFWEISRAVAERGLPQSTPKLLAAQAASSELMDESSRPTGSHQINNWGVPAFEVESLCGLI